MRFPADFLWGAATAAHQVEGGNRWNDWWEAEEDGRLSFASGEACRHWELYERDFDLALAWGHGAHRFSLEWSRVEPEEGRWSREALDHYRDVVRALRERGLEPFVSLYHFTLPGWLARRGGWLARDAARRFALYVERVADELGGDVRWWVTVNEPTVYASQGFVLGERPPFRRGAWVAAGRVLRRLAQAHVAARRVLRERSPGSSVGLAHSALHAVPCDPTRWRDRAAVRLRDALWNRAFFRLLGAGRSGGRELDFLGINYYTRTIVRSEAGGGSAAWLGRTCRRAHHRDLGPRASTGWEVFPEGLEAVLVRFAELGVPLVVTENGVATEDEELRSRALREHVLAVGRALERGVDVRGYFWWSLLDNFEWALGWGPRYGLAAVEEGTFRRVPRPAAEELAAVCRSGGVS